MTKIFEKFDPLFFLAIVFLLIIGLSIIWSVAPSLFPQQLLFAVLGLFCYLFFSSINYRLFRNFSLIIYLLGLAILLIALVLGPITRGSTRWIKLGTFLIQPSEFLKPFYVLFLADYLASNKIGKNIKSILIFVILTLLPIIIIFLQPDFGNVIIYLVILISVIFTLISNLRYFIYSLILSVSTAPIIWHLLKDYQKQRIITFLNPSFDPLGHGYNVLQAIIAVGSGELLGRGLGRGTQSHLRFLPEFHTDFIFASLSEELGFFGALLLILIYGYLLIKIIIKNDKLDNQFARIVNLGIFTMLLVQIFINIGMNIGLLPITGITLPLVSYGGSSLLATMISLGLVSNITNHCRKQEILEIK